jgi:hypothetical protein
MDGSGPGKNFAAVWYAAWNEIFLSSPYRNPLSIDDQRIAALYDEHVFVVFVDMSRGCRGFTTGPKRHLAPVSAVEDKTLNAWGRLIGPCDLVRGMLHEFREVFHSFRILSNSSKRKKRDGCYAVPLLLIPGRLLGVKP